jgi:coenzyme F420-reducing hydrogenase delta subunit/Pyruvate/2-oxoacid:ferredoxin oxidoreductase delta subunit
VLLFGDRKICSTIAKQLVCTDVKVFSAGPNEVSQDSSPNEDFRWVHGNIQQCEGFPGNFNVIISLDSGYLKIHCLAIVIAFNDNTVPESITDAVKRSNRVQTLTKLERTAFDENCSNNIDGTIVFLNGLTQESNPGVLRRILETALRIGEKSPTTKTIILSNNLKVADSGLESLCRHVRSIGGRFIKISSALPPMSITENGSVMMEVFDEALHESISVIADHVVLDEIFEIDQRILDIAQRLKLRTDAIGFLQEDNIHRLPHFTNRKGIFVAGAARSVLGRDESLDEVDALCSSVTAFMRKIQKGTICDVAIHRERCARCLTCFRACPFAAVKIGEHMEIVTAACEGCGICVAACPGKAIEMVSSRPTTEIETYFANDRITVSPLIVAFCCGRSAGTAINNLPEGALPLGLKVVEVPCAGRISINDILSTFEMGADGVMIFACHDGNCFSQFGNRIARHKFDVCVKMLTSIDIKPERLLFATFAANMGTDIQRTISEFESGLRILEIKAWSYISEI